MHLILYSTKTSPDFIRNTIAKVFSRHNRIDLNNYKPIYNNLEREINSIFHCLASVFQSRREMFKCIGAYYHNKYKKYLLKHYPYYLFSLFYSLSNISFTNRESVPSSKDEVVTYLCALDDAIEKLLVMAARDVAKGIAISLRALNKNEYDLVIDPKELVTRRCCSLSLTTKDTAPRLSFLVLLT